VTVLPFGSHDDQLQAERLAELLDALDDGRSPDVDPREDPELASLLQTASRLREADGRVEAQPAYVRRSRGLLQHRLAHRARRTIWRRAWTVSASAAAAALLVMAVVALNRGGSEGDVQVVAAVAADTGAGQPEAVSSAEAVPEAVEAAAASTNATTVSVADELSRLREAVSGIEASISRGEPVEPRLLEEAAAGTASVATRIKNEPESLSGQTVLIYVQAANAAREALRSVTVAEGGEAALAAAQSAADDGVVTAARFFGENPDALPEFVPSAEDAPATGDAGVDEALPAEADEALEQSATPEAG
jgi:hypothetical protein